MKIIGVIPARLASSRLPGKVLLPLNGKPLLWHVFHAARKANQLDRVIIAADDKKILRAMQDWDIPCILTSKKHKSGTDRVGEASEKEKADFIVNIQGDEPMIHPSNINKIVRAWKEDRKAGIYSLMCPFSSQKEAKDPSVVKVVTDQKSLALYFSRSLIPADSAKTGKVVRYRHIGLYGYTASVLKELCSLKPSSLERAEKLEQLRFLENGYKIRMIKTNKDSPGVDTKKDYDKVRMMI